jgi:hypothetical protein
MLVAIFDPTGTLEGALRATKALLVSDRADLGAAESGVVNHCA